MRRLWVSLLTVLAYSLAQMLPGFILRSHLLGHMSQIKTAKFMIFTQVSLFILAAIIIILINLKVKNPTTLEAGRKEPKRYIIPWALLGFCLVMVYQVIISLIYFTIMGSQQTSPNTERLMAIAKKMPIFIILISIVGPILEEFVFRKVFFGELYNAIKANRVVSFLIASIVSSLVFALAHNDMKFIPMYFGMGMIFSLAYVFTKRIAVPIGIHMLQNGTVVFMQVFGGEALKKAQEHANFILHFILN
ncbi:CPBP family intramembrane metalloprotease [Staphylococcus capitis]|uniref:intramembrane glutamic endopeptidase MroQ n=1 Tax=Staphylococcus capitis TaxID=29388 RepID=UPI001C110DA1|nr:type II CAAX endopeptidase family protein [Staphylococcus capitis]MBU5292101.1 CPBP family intramembrane metalloprotease [Staphylococcus capitis]